MNCKGPLLQLKSNNGPYDYYSQGAVKFGNMHLSSTTIHETSVPGEMSALFCTADPVPFQSTSLLAETCCDLLH